MSRFSGPLSEESEVHMSDKDDSVKKPTDDKDVRVKDDVSCVTRDIVCDNCPRRKECGK